MSSSDYRQKILDKVKDAGEPAPESNSLGDLAGSETKITQLVEVLADPSSSPEAKNNALNLLKTISVFSPVLPKKMPAYVNVLRGLMDDPDVGIRTQAFGTLACMKDEVAQERKQNSNLNWSLPTFLSSFLVLRSSSELGSAVSAQAAVEAVKTAAITKTANEPAPEVLAGTQH